MKRHVGKWLSHIITGCLAAALFCGCFSGCVDTSADELPNRADTTDYTQYDEELTAQLKTHDGLYLVAENTVLALYIDGKTAEVAVEEKKTGHRWYTNPADRADDAPATGGFRDELNSQFLLQYINSSEKVFNVNTAKDAVANDNVTFMKVDGGIRVNYTLGEMKKTYLVPYVVEATRFEEFLGRLDDIDAAMMTAYYSRVSLSELDNDADKALYRQRYPVLDKYDIYCLSNVEIGEELPDMMKQDIEGYLQKAGYTKEDLRYDNEKNGVSVEENENVTVGISVEYRLDGGTLTARVPINSILYDESKIHLTKLSCLPYFGAANATQDGYLFVPDGSGAIIRLSSALDGSKKNIETYHGKIYGEDPTLQKDQLDTADNIAVYMPVFGIKANDAAFLTVAESGASYMTINADVSGKNNSYNVVYTDVALSNNEMQTDAVMNLSGTRVYQKGLIDEDIVLRTMFLSGQNADYIGMAKAYRSYLIERGDLPSEPIETTGLPLHFTAVGAVSYKTTRLGIPVVSQKKLTGYTELQDMIEQLKTAGVEDMMVNYSAWCNDGMDTTKPNKVKPISELGDKKELATLAKYVDNAHVDFYTDVDFSFVSKYKGVSYNINKDSARELSNVPAYYAAYNPATMEIDPEVRQAIVSPGKYGEFTDSFLKAYGKWGFKGIGLPSLGNRLVSDFNEKGMILRGQTLELVRQQTEAIAKNSYRLAVGTPNIYAVRNATLLVGLPMRSSGHYMLDDDVPFYQAVVSGLIPYSAPAYNLSADPKADKLKLLETGSIASFQWMYAQNLALKDSQETKLNSASFADWKDAAVALYKELVAAGACANAEIVGHEEVANQVFVTRYATGTDVYVNYSVNDVAIGQINVPAGSYTVVEGGGI